MLPLGTRFSKAPNPGSAYRAEMGAVVLPDLDRCRRSPLHRHIGCNSGYRPLPVLCLCRDLPGAADPGANDLQGMSGLFPSLRGANGSRGCGPDDGLRDEAIQAPFLALDRFASARDDVQKSLGLAQTPKSAPRS